MEAQMLTVVAEMVARSGKADDLRKELLALVDPTRGEEGCIQYDLHESNETPGRFLFYENWTSKEMLERHLESAHLRRFKSLTDDLLAEPLRISFYTRVG